MQAPSTAKARSRRWCEMPKIGQKSLLLFQEASYSDTIKGLFGSALIAGYRLDEASGTVAADYSGHAYNGAYSNVTLGQPTIGGGSLSALFVPASSSYVNIYSAGLAGAFNKDEMTIQFIMKAVNAAWWNAVATSRQFTIAADVNNRVLCNLASGAPNVLALSYTGGGTTDVLSIPTSTTSPFVVTLTVSKSNDRIRIYKDGVKVGADATGVGSWTGALAATTAVIGAASTGGTAGHAGWISNLFILNKEATQAEITTAMPPLAAS